MTTCLVAAGVLLLLFSLFCVVAAGGAVFLWRRKSQAQAAGSPGSPGWAAAPVPPSPFVPPAPPAYSDLDGATVVVPLPQRQYGRIVFLSGPVAGSSYDVSPAGLWIGRDASADVIIQSSSVSKRHTWIGVRSDQAVLIDEGSTNGTFLEGQRSDRLRERALAPGDVIVIANDIARFRYDSE
ncbi:MAG TPA: FHA domain-containing protein [Thermoanaerobaculia bacterium]|nr:FHA domain-containing protein [Thermoanaerobaculia bacterium]